MGTALRLDTHAQNPARDRAIDGGSAIDRFGGFLAPTSGSARVDGIDVEADPVGTKRRLL